MKPSPVPATPSRWRSLLRGALVVLALLCTGWAGGWAWSSARATYDTWRAVQQEILALRYLRYGDPSKSFADEARQKMALEAKTKKAGEKPTERPGQAPTVNP